MWTQQRLIDELIERGRFDAPVMLQVVFEGETYSLPLEKVGAGLGEVSLFATLEPSVEQTPEPPAPSEDGIPVSNVTLPVSDNPRLPGKDNKDA